MTIDEIINEYEKVVAMLAVELASGELEGHTLEKRRKEFELFRAGRDALIEKKMAMKV